MLRPMSQHHRPTPPRPPTSPTLGGDTPRIITVLQGEHHVSAAPNDVITTVLGSCIAACLWDARAGIGGMNHFLLPDGPTGANASLRYGLHAMELLINALLRGGANRTALRAKIFGGAHLQSHLPDIGSRNTAFAQEFLQREGIACVGGSVGGDRGRRLRFWPHGGRAQQFLLPPADVPEQASSPLRMGDVLLF